MFKQEDQKINCLISEIPPHVFPVGKWYRCSTVSPLVLSQLFLHPSPPHSWRVENRTRKSLYGAFFWEARKPKANIHFFFQLHCQVDIPDQMLRLELEMYVILLQNLQKDIFFRLWAQPRGISQPLFSSGFPPPIKWAHLRVRTRKGNMELVWSLNFFKVLGGTATFTCQAWDKTESKTGKTEKSSDGKWKRGAGISSSETGSQWSTVV